MVKFFAGLVVGLALAIAAGAYFDRVEIRMISSDAMTHPDVEATVITTEVG